MFKLNLLSLIKKIMNIEDNKTSIFENIPETIQQNFSEEQPKKNVIKKEKNVFLIMCGNDDTEYYTETVPIITNDNITLHNAVKKGIIKEEVLNTFVEEYFCLECDSELNFSLNEGILMKKHFKDELFWLTKSLNEAQISIKDKIIMKYNQVVPSLINDIKNLQQQNKKVKNNYKQNNYNDDDDLINL